MMQLPNKILVVDDDPQSRDHVDGLLAREGYACRQAGSASEALVALERDRTVAVVVSDVALPSLDGIRLGRTIRERFPDRPWLQILYVTAQPKLEFAVSALRLGAVDFLAKPVTPVALLAAVNRAVAVAHESVRSVPEHALAPRLRPGRRDESRAVSTAESMIRSALEYITDLRRLRQESGVLAEIDESSWTILLEVYHAELTRRRLSVSKLCARDETSQTTVWRRIRALEDGGYLVRDQDPVDGRRSFVVLSESAAQAVADFMTRADGLLATAG